MECSITVRKLCTTQVLLLGNAAYINKHIRYTDMYVHIQLDNGIISSQMNQSTNKMLQLFWYRLYLLYNYRHPALLVLLNCSIVNAKKQKPHPRNNNLFITHWNRSHGHQTKNTVSDYKVNPEIIHRHPKRNRKQWTAARPLPRTYLGLELRKRQTNLVHHIHLRKHMN
jgi:hypothetical protein